MPSLPQGWVPPSKAELEVELSCFYSPSTLLTAMKMLYYYRTLIWVSSSVDWKPLKNRGNTLFTSAFQALVNKIFQWTVPSILLDKINKHFIHIISFNTLNKFLNHRGCFLLVIPVKDQKCLIELLPCSILWHSQPGYIKRNSMANIWCGPGQWACCDQVSDVFSYVNDLHLESKCRIWVATGIFI